MLEPILELYRSQLGLKPVTLREWMTDGAGGRLWRVSLIERTQCTVIGFDDAGVLCESKAAPPGNPLAVGDWVLLDDAGQGDTASAASVRAVLPRTSLLERGAVHREGHSQLIAANIDTVFIVAAFAETLKLERRGLRARRLDRFIAAVKGGGATPVVLLNKVDLSTREDDDLEALRHDLTARLGGVEVVCVSATQGSGLEALQTWLGPGETVAFIGPSGVGKSSIVNTLILGARQEVGEVRAGDTKGRHTTTRRELLMLPSGALVVDTPGMREFAVLAEDHVAGFDDVSEVAKTCRFTNCAHAREPGCAVHRAVEEGTLSRERVESYLDLDREAERLRGKHDPYARHLDNAEQRRFSRMVRSSQKKKKR